MSTPYKDYYEILGIDRKAADSEIKAAFRKSARKYHPDLHAQGDKAAAEEKFKEINEAYTVLSDPEKKAQYDMFGKNEQGGGNYTQDGGGQTRGGSYEQGSGYTQGGQNRSPYPDMGGFASRSSGQSDEDGFSDFFESLFGRQAAGDTRGRSAKPKDVRGQDVESQLELTLDEAYRGTKKQIQFTLRSTCPSCQGTGAANQQICRTCSGTGGKTTVKSLDVNIPAFVMEGNKIRLKGQGGEGSANGIPGDLLLTITILPNALFTRSGSDLETVIKIRPDQAVLGCSFPVPTMDGEVMLTIPPMVHNGKKLRLKSKGWTQKNGSRGDEIVKVMIDIPLTISSAEKEIYRRLADLRSDAPKS